MEWIFIVFALIAVLIFLKRIKFNKSLLEKIARRKGGTISRSLKWGNLPALQIPIGPDTAFFYFTPNRECCLWIEGTQLISYPDSFITDKNMPFRRVRTGNQNFDNEFTASQHLNTKFNKTSVLSTVSPEFQNCLIELKEEVCRDIVNQFIEFSHPKDAKVATIKIENFSMPKTDRVERLILILDKMLNVYQAFRKSGNLTGA